jgi:hypothetical protein
MRTPQIELLWWEGCPSTERALAELRDALRDVGLPQADVRMREIQTESESQELGFLGSPTILIDGRDPLPTAPDDHPGLSCRIYRQRGGTISPTPDPDDLRDALRRSVA